MLERMGLTLGEKVCSVQLLVYRERLCAYGITIVDQLS